MLAECTPADRAVAAAPAGRTPTAVMGAAAAAGKECR
jgi:hypothetical protein